MSRPLSVTVIGGGISGLSAAFHLSRRFAPRLGTRITLVEKSPRLGGWILSERTRVQDERGYQADALIEGGPRTLRPTSKAILELVNLLGLSSSVLTVTRNAPAARNRFLHLPGKIGLTPIPNSLLSLSRSPLAKFLVSAVLNDARRSNGAVLNTHSLDTNDESVDAFLTRHFGVEFAQIFGSALVHGIYAADSRTLSVRAAFPALLHMEEGGKGSVVRGAIRNMLSSSRVITKDAEYDVGDMGELMKDVSVYSFKDGMQTLTDGIARRLEERENVEIIRDDGVATLGRAKSANEFELTTQAGRRITSSHVVVAMSLPQLQQLIVTSSQRGSSEGALPPLPHLVSNPSSSVTVVNLVFPPSSSPIHPPGFGYLIPRPSSEYPASSFGMLGTVFDSCALPTQDNGIPMSSLQSGFSQFTKLTVMLGGPYGTPSQSPSSSSFLPLLLETLRRHLGHSQPLPEPCLVRIREHKDCIPTPTVGHATRVAELADAVRARWGSNAMVIGAGVGGVSVGDCVEGGRRAALALDLKE